MARIRDVGGASVAAGTAVGLLFFSFTTPPNSEFAQSVLSLLGQTPETWILPTNAIFSALVGIAVCIVVMLIFVFIAVVWNYVREEL